MRKYVTGLCVIAILAVTARSWEQDADTVEVDVLAKTEKSWNGTTLPRYPNGQPEVTILRITIPPKTRLPLHKHPVISAGVLLKGSLTVVTEDKKTTHLKAGDSIVEIIDKWHYGVNEGRMPAEIIVFYAGVKDSPVTVQKEKE